MILNPVETSNECIENSRCKRKGIEVILKPVETSCTLPNSIRTALAEKSEIRHGTD